MGEGSSVAIRVEPYLRVGFHAREETSNYAAETGVAVTAHTEVGGHNAQFSLAPNFSMAADIKRTGVCGLAATKLLLPFTIGVCGDYNLEDHSLEPKGVIGLSSPPLSRGDRNASLGLFFAVHDLTDVKGDGASITFGLSGRI
jgi:hypothetical protein